MTDKEIFERFMGWMGMVEDTTKVIDNNTVIKYKDINNWDTRFTTQGYDEFYSGAVFDKDGKMLKGFIDSHVAYESDNAKDIFRLLRD